MSKIFVRERRHAGPGSGRPRFAIVAVQGGDLNVFRSRVRQAELQAIADAIDAEIVHLPRGEQREGGGRHRRRERDRD